MKQGPCRAQKHTCGPLIYGHRRTRVLQDGGILGRDVVHLGTHVPLYQTARRHVPKICNVHISRHQYLSQMYSIRTPPLRVKFSQSKNKPWNIFRRSCAGLCAILIYRVIQEKREIFWEVTVSVFVRRKVRMYMCLIVIGYRDRAVWMHMCLIVNGYRDRAVWMHMCLIVIGYRDRAVWMYKYRSIVNGNREIEITYC
jgi:hypothetical protein